MITAAVSFAALLEALQQRVQVGRLFRGNRRKERPSSACVKRRAIAAAAINDALEKRNALGLLRLQRLLRRRQFRAASRRRSGRAFPTGVGTNTDKLAA